MKWHPISKYAITLSLMITVYLPAILVYPQGAEAISGNAWQAGRIIDDGVFFNPSSMTANDIQIFLNAKVPTCDTWGAVGPYNGYPTRAEWAAANGKPQPPYTCLKNYTENISGQAADSYCKGPVSAGTKNAAQIIYEVAQACSLNPRVLIVLLQKEQSLVTDDWPWPVQYQKATGYGCPDTAPCDPVFAGFFNQVWYAARQYQRYAQQPQLFNYRSGQTSFVQYHPNTACGGSNIFMQNQATAGLYNYTPYQPNQAALNNLYGTGDSCSAYGNRNFWRLYWDWFGSVYAEAYNYDFVDSSFADITMEPGYKRVGHYIKIRNTGYETWYADDATPVGKHATRLALKNYENSPFADTGDPSWLGTRNQIKMTPDVVPPGEVATFIFNLVGPDQLSSNPVIQHFVPVLDGSGFYYDKNLVWRITTRAGDYSFQSAQNFPTILYPNQEITTTIKLTNNGFTTWYADGVVPNGGHAVRLALRGYENSPFADTSDVSWLGTRNQIKLQENSVLPGETATFVFKLHGPLSAMSRDMYLIPVLDGVGFMKDIRLFSTITVPVPSASYSFVSATNPPSIMTIGSSVEVSVTIKNTGTVVWTNESSGIPRIRLMMVRPNYRSSVFYDSSDPRWIASSQITYSGNQVGLNGSLTFNFKWKAPPTAGTYVEYFAPVLDGYQLMPDIGMQFVVTVTP